jgi:hypothetical protein
MLMNCCTDYASNVRLKNENNYSYQIPHKNNDMEESTQKPTICVDNLAENRRSYPGHILAQHYDNGRRFCFRIGKIHYRVWQWPWPEWIGIPSRERLDDWFDLIDAWKLINKGKYSEDHVEKCIQCMLPYL